MTDIILKNINDDQANFFGLLMNKSYESDTLALGVLGYTYEILLTADVPRFSTAQDDLPVGKYQRKLAEPREGQNEYYSQTKLTDFRYEDFYVPDDYIDICGQLLRWHGFGRVTGPMFLTTVNLNFACDKIGGGHEIRTLYQNGLGMQGAISDVETDHWRE